MADKTICPTCKQELLEKDSKLAGLKIRYCNNSECPENPQARVTKKQEPLPVSTVSIESQRTTITSVTITEQTETSLRLERDIPLETIPQLTGEQLLEANMRCMKIIQDYNIADSDNTNLATWQLTFDLVRENILSFVQQRKLVFAKQNQDKKVHFVEQRTEQRKAKAKKQVSKQNTQVEKSETAKLPKEFRKLLAYAEANEVEITNPSQYATEKDLKDAIRRAIIAKMN